jgi:hypothetical protein
VAIHNQLVTAEQVRESRAVIAAEVAGGRPRRSLASILIGKGYITALAASAVQKAVRDYAAKHFGTAEPAPGLPPEPRPMSDPAPAGMSQKLQPVEPPPAGRDRRFRLEAPEHGRAATMTVDCSRLYPADAPALEAAVHRLLETGHGELRLDLRRVKNVPSVIVGAVGQAVQRASADGRDFLLLCTEATARMVRLVLGNAVRIRAGAPPRDGGLRPR